jgi:hypothetical protein
MAIGENKSAFVVTGAQSIGLSQMFSVTASSGNPTYLVLTGLDRDEYTAGATGATGSLSGNGGTDDFSGIGGDGRGVGIVFTYQASTGLYYNSIYGTFNQLSFTASGSLDDVTNLSLFGTSNLGLANADADNAYSMMQDDASGYLGSATVATEPSFSGPVPAEATPDSIASVAQGFVGKAWNMDGCWVLASTIAAEAGASLPVQSTEIGLPGQANGEWMVAYDGPAGQTGNWQSMVTAGEIVVIGTPGGGGHITTCVSGSGSGAMLVDNATFENSSGKITNPANDGSSSDILIAGPHAASQEWSGVQASSVVIYELDTPIVSTRVASDSIACKASQSLASLFSTTDPAGKAITEYQVYDTSAGDSLSLNGAVDSAHTAATAVTASALAAVSLVAGATAGADTLDVRAFNGSYWGDWQTLGVSVAAAPVASAPALTDQTANQTWTAGKLVSLVLASNTFTDPQGEKLTCTATGSNGTALPGWLKFNATTDSFSGTAPITPQTLGIKVTATDTSGLATSESFSATVQALAPALTDQTANQTWTAGKLVSLVLASNTFTDPQGEKLTCTATESNGTALPGWLKFNATTDSFSGTAPITPQTLGIKVTATDSSGLATCETFSATVQASPPVLAKQTSNQTWTDGQTVNFLLPSGTFVDPQGESLGYVAEQISGPNVRSWLHFNGSTGDFSGLTPTTASGTVGIEVHAVDPSGLAAAETFSVTFASASGHAATHGIGAVGAQDVSPTELWALRSA